MKPNVASIGRGSMCDLFQVQSDLHVKIERHQYTLIISIFITTIYKKLNQILINKIILWLYKINGFYVFTDVIY